MLSLQNMCMHINHAIKEEEEHQENTDSPILSSSERTSVDVCCGILSYVSDQIGKLPSTE